MENRIYSDFDNYDELIFEHERPFKKEQNKIYNRILETMHLASGVRLDKHRIKYLIYRHSYLNAHNYTYDINDLLSGQLKGYYICLSVIERLTEKFRNLHRPNISIQFILDDKIIYKNIFLIATRQN